MNERIEAFIDQMSRTGLPYQAGDRELTVTGSDLEYFAELIIRECCKVSDEIEPLELSWKTSRFVKLHFGIEK